jgi:2-polyprenyl-3-methyl-5-hydroxy-6-metoxy-1,4-benzoquinol methylase
VAGTDAAWEAWGQRDPYYGVVSHPLFRRGVIEDHRGEFFRSGREVVQTRLAEYERVFGPLPRGSALDFGCGVGRLALPLAEEFDRVVGLDIALSMLVEARRNAATSGADNVTFARSDDDLTGAPGGFDFVHSYIVLQHIPARRGMRIVDRLVEKVNPGGGLSLHVSVDTRNPARRLGSTLLHRVPLAYKASSWLKGRPLSDPAMQMNGYSVQAILVRLAAEQMTEVSVRSEVHHGVLTFLLAARRPPVG